MTRVQHAGSVHLQRALKPLLHRQQRRHSLATCNSIPSYVQHLLARTDWLLPDPAVQVSTVEHSGTQLHIIRDDLLHPFLGGNKFRKLDGLWGGPTGLRQATDVVTCGGLQSAHTVAVAAACAQHGIRCHLLVRGEPPAVPTGHHLYARLFASRVRYVSRREYADRQAMFDNYLQQLQHQEEGAPEEAAPEAFAAAATLAQQRQQPPPQPQQEAQQGFIATDSAHAPMRIAVIPEGAATPAALLGLIRLVAWLWEHSALAGQRCNIVVDSGTGATATGLALGAALLGLPWKVTGVMLAAEESYYQQQQQELAAAFCTKHAMPEAAAADMQQQIADRLCWVRRNTPRKFGVVLAGEVAACRAVAQQHGIVLDPIWSLAAWEVACQLVAAGGGSSGGDSNSGSSRGSSNSSGLGAEADVNTGSGGVEVVMLHTGGMLGLCGLAQRFPDQF